MANMVNEVFTQIKDLSKNLSASQKVSIMIAVAAVMAVIMVSSIWSNKPQFQIAYSGSTGEDVSAVVNAINGKKIPYRLSIDGMSVSVPSDKIQEVKLLISSQGISAGGGAGFELFDKKNIGMTSFMQRINYQRALQGELARTITQLKEVEHARVHIVMAKESLFAEKEESASASVVVKFKRGRILSQSQINGIAQLVSNGVEGLEIDGVSVIDSSGNVLTRGVKSGLSGVVSNNMELQRSFERGLERKITPMLDKGVGIGNSVVRVSAVMDFEQSEQVEEIFDPDRVVIRSEQRSEENLVDSEGISGGVPGVTSNLGEGGAGGGSASSNASKTSETINYEITKITKKTVAPIGQIKKLSVAVLLNGSYEVTEDGKKTFIPRTDEEIKIYENLVMKVVGFNAQRGDQLEVSSVPFDTTFDASQASVETEGRGNEFWISIARNASIAVVGILFFLLILRPLVKWLVTPVENTMLMEGGPKTVKEMEGEMAAKATYNENGSTRDNVMAAAKNEPELVHNVVKGWIDE